ERDGLPARQGQRLEDEWAGQALPRLAVQPRGRVEDRVRDLLSLKVKHDRQSQFRSRERIIGDLWESGMLPRTAADRAADGLRLGIERSPGSIRLLTGVASKPRALSEIAPEGDEAIPDPQGRACFRVRQKAARQSRPV